MSGIAGIIGESSPEKIIPLITESMKHDYFYRTETYIHQNTAFGLSTFIPDNKIVFNPETQVIGLMEGEIFGNSRGGYLSEAPERSSPPLLEDMCREKSFSSPAIWKKVSGRFVFAFYDIKEKKLFLITDHCGFKPLYYTITTRIVDSNLYTTRTAKKFIFSSQVGAILEHPDATQEPNLEALTEYAIFNFPLAEKTFIKNIYRIPPAEIWEIDAQLNITRKRYFSFPELISHLSLNAEQSLQLVPEIFKLTIDNFLKPACQQGKEDKPIGLTLTGGYDTRTILSALPGDRVVHTLTVGTAEDPQVIIASQLANTVKCGWLVQNYEADFVRDLERLVWKTVGITDGLCDITHTGWLYMFEKHRNYLDPCFTGLGGSELIRGLQNVDSPMNRNSKIMLQSKNPSLSLKNLIKKESSYGFFSYELLKNSFNSHLSSLISPSSTNERATSFMLYEIFRKYYGAVITLEESQVRIRAPYMNYSLISFILQTPFSILHTPQFSHNLFERSKGQRLSATIIEKNNPLLLSIPTDRGYAPSLNIRPFGLPLILFHRLRKRVVASSTCDEHLRAYAKKILEETKTLNREYYNIPKLKSALADYPNWSPGLWQGLAKVVTFELWFRQFIEE